MKINYCSWNHVTGGKQKSCDDSEMWCSFLYPLHTMFLGKAYPLCDPSHIKKSLAAFLSARPIVLFTLFSKRETKCSDYLISLFKTRPFSFHKNNHHYFSGHCKWKLLILTHTYSQTFIKFGKKLLLWFSRHIGFSSKTNSNYYNINRNPTIMNVLFISVDYG